MNGLPKYVSEIQMQSAGKILRLAKEIYKLSTLGFIEIMKLEKVAQQELFRGWG